jgi:hypothetical protein
MNLLDVDHENWPIPPHPSIAKAASTGKGYCYGLDGRGFRVQFPAGTRDSPFSLTSTLALRPTQLPIHWEWGGGVSLGSEAGHSIEIVGALPPRHLTSFWCLSNYKPRIANVIFTLWRVSTAPENHTVPVDKLILETASPPARLQITRSKL